MTTKKNPDTYLYQMQDPLGTMAGMKTIPQDYGKFIIKTATGGVSFGTNAAGETSDMMTQKIVG